MRAIERAALVAYAGSPRFLRAVLDAQSIVAAHEGYAVACSWGKDSTVLLHLAASVWPAVGCTSARYSDFETLPDMPQVRDAVLARCPDVRYHEVRCPGEWEMYERAGDFFMDAISPGEKAAVRWWRASFIAAQSAARTAMQARGTFLGLRHEESRARRLTVARKGVSYTKRDGEAIALPLARWTGREVWAYLVAHELPWLHIYDAAPDRDRARSAFCFATGGANTIWRHGVWQQWREAYPDHFAHWPRRFPAMRAYL